MTDYDLAAEQRLLGAMMQSPAGIVEAVDQVDEDDFFRGFHGEVFRVVVEQWASVGTVDAVAVSNALVESHLADQPHVEVADMNHAAAFTVAGIASDAARVRTLADRRRAQQSLDRAKQRIADGDEPATVIGDLQADAPRSTDALKLLSIDELAGLGEVDTLVERRIPVGLTALWGPSGSHKTFAAVEFACCVASGHRWYGHRTSGPAPVIYCVAEGVQGMRARIDAWMQARDGHPGKLKVYPHPLRLDDARDQRRLLAACRSVRPALVVVDTYRRNLGGSENDSEVANALVGALDRVREECGASSLVVHHSGGSEETKHRMRGIQVLYEHADCVIAAEYDDGLGRVTLTNQPPRGKQRDLEPWAHADFMRTQVGESLVLDPAGPVGVRAEPARAAF